MYQNSHIHFVSLFILGTSFGPDKSDPGLRIQSVKDGRCPGMESSLEQRVSSFNKSCLWLPSLNEKVAVRTWLCGGTFKNFSGWARNSTECFRHETNFFQELSCF